MSYWQTQSKDSDEQLKTLAEENKKDFRPISQTYLKIHQYEVFYRDFQMASKEAVVSNALNEAIRVYALIDYLQQQEIVLSDEKRQFQRKILNEQLSYDLNDPKLKPYFEKMFQVLNIDEQDYIEHYLLINKEHEILSNEMFSSHKGLVQDETGHFSYPSGDQEKLFQEKMGISFDYLEYLAESKSVHIGPASEKFDLPFATDTTYFNFTKNQDGKVIFASKEFDTIDLTEEQRHLIYDIENQYDLHDLARYNFQQYKDALQQEAALENENHETANELLEIFKIVERTIDWDIGEVTNYQFNEIPSYDINQLRKHKDLTIQLYEYEYYHRSEDVHEKFYAYRIANEEIVAMYGLFNYLKQDFGLELDDAARSSVRTKLENLLTRQLENSYFKEYMDELLMTFNIPLTTYIEDYLLVIEEYEMLLQLMREQQIGIDQDGRYNKGWVEARYRTAADLLWEEQFEKMWEMQTNEVVEPLDPQPDLKFTLMEYAPAIGINKEGQYIFVNMYSLPIWLTVEQRAIFDLLVKTYDLPVLSRYSITEYIDKLEQLKADKTKKKQLLEILHIYKNTITE